MTRQITGILLTNTGTPDAPTIAAVRRYLREFLSDPRIVQLPRILWPPILYGLVLTTRPRRSAKLYQQIWTPAGSPMRVFMQKIATTLQQKLPADTLFEIGMNYGQPTISQALANLYAKQMNKLVVLPLFPQYSNATTAASFDRVLTTLKKWPALPEIHFINNYAAETNYILALAASVRRSWHSEGQAKHLLISFHGIPEQFVKAGDPYAKQCEQTAQLLAAELHLPKENWTLCYQSRFGYQPWLKPATQHLFSALPKRGIRQIEVICPGFAVDCLETLEEIMLRGKQLFLQAGGTSLQYIPALNDSDEHIKLLFEILGC